MEEETLQNAWAKFEKLIFKRDPICKNNKIGTMLAKYVKVKKKRKEINFSHIYHTCQF